MDKIYLKKIFYVVLVVFIVIGLIFSLVHFYFTSPKSELVTRFAAEETVYEVIESPAYVMRNEYVIDKKVDGRTVLYYFEDGEKVAKGSVLAKIYPFDDKNEVVEEIYECRKQIEVCKSIISASDSYTLTEVNDEISSVSEELNSLLSMNDTTGLEELQNKLLVLMGVRELKTDTSIKASVYFSRIEALESQINTLTDSLGADYESVVADRSGYFYRDVDGYEDYWSTEDLKTITCGELSDVFDTQMPEDDRVGKIVVGYEWYALCCIPSGNISDFQIGDSYDISITNEKDLVVSMQLHKIIYTYGEDTSALVFVSSESPKGFDYSRFQYLDISFAEYKGYSIPVTAVRYVDGVPGVYVLYGYRVVFREICPIYNRDGIIIADPNASSVAKNKMLSHYDNVILKGFDLYVDKIIE